MAIDRDPHAGDSAGKPLVSVVIPSYNQGDYLEKAINSVLLQDFVDYELLISDDASQDHSWEIIKRFNDRRLSVFRQTKNLGPVGNLVFLIEKACGKYVALLNSDDYWLPGKLGKQVAVMEAEPRLGACFTWADLVDEAGASISGAEALWRDVFRQPDRTQAQWLDYFYYQGNCLCHPSMLIRREVYRDLGYYNPALRQLPDFDMWIRLVKRYPIRILQETLVMHLRNSVNSSALNDENTARNITELQELFAGFFSDIPDELFVAAFGSRFRLHPRQMSPERLECEKLFLLLDGSFVPAAAKLAAIRRLYKAFRDPRLEQTLLADYNFSIFDYYRLTGSSGVGNLLLEAMKGGAKSAADVYSRDKSICSVAKAYFRRLVARH